MPRYCPRCGETLHTHSTTKGGARKGARVGSRLAYDDTPSVKKKRGPSAYNIKYSKAFKKVEPRFKKKNGSWKQDGFKNAGKAARKLIK